MNTVAFFAYSIYTWTISVLSRNKMLFSFLFLVGCLLILLTIDLVYFSDIINYKRSIEGIDTFNRFEPGWRILTRSLYLLFGNSTVVVFVIYFMNLLLSLLIVGKIKYKGILRSALYFFFISKWLLYIFITIRFGLASLIFLYGFLVFKENDFKLNFLNIILFGVSFSIHYSIGILIGIVLLFWFRRNIRTTIFLFCGILIYLISSSISLSEIWESEFYETLGVFYQYIALGFELNFSKTVFLALLLVILVNTFPPFKYRINLLIFFAVLFAILLQSYDALNRLSFTLMVGGLFCVSKPEKTSKLLVFYLYCMGIIFLLRYSVFSVSNLSIIKQ